MKTFYQKSITSKWYWGKSNQKQTFITMLTRPSFLTLAHEGTFVVLTFCAIFTWSILALINICKFHKSLILNTKHWTKRGNSLCWWIVINRITLQILSLQERNFHLWRVYSTFNNRDGISRRLSLCLKSQQLLLHPKEWLRTRTIRKT